MKKFLLLITILLTITIYNIFAKDYNFKYFSFSLPDDIKFSGKYNLSDKEDIQLNYRWDSKDIVINIDITNNSGISQMPLKLWAKIQTNILDKKIKSLFKGINIEKISEIKPYKYIDNYLYQKLIVGKSGYKKDVFVLYIKNKDLYYQFLFIYSEKKQQDINNIINSIKLN